MRAVRPVEIVEALPFVQFGFEIDVAFVAEELIELLSIRSMRPFDFAIQLRCAAFDICMPDAKVFDVPMELRLELMSVVRADFPDPEREFFDDVINEVDRVGLGVSFIDFERPHTRRIINRGILETPYFFALLSDECQELDVHLDVVSGNLFLIPLCVNLAHPCSPRQPV